MLIKHRRILFPIISLALALAFLLMLAQITRSVTAQIPAITEADVSILSADTARLEFELKTPPIQLKEAEFAIPGLETTIQEPGAPALPYFSRLIGLPPGATLSLSVIESGVRSERMTAVPTVPQADLSAPNTESRLRQAQPADVEAAPDFQFTEMPPLITQPDPAIFSRDAEYPTAVYQLSDVMYFRDMRLVELRLYPVRYNPVRQTLVQAQNIRVSIRFEGADWEGLRPLPAANNAYSQSLTDKILNYEQAQNWRSLPPEVANAPATQLPTDRDVYKIEINQDGLYQLTYDDLNQAGMPVANVNPNAFEMMYQGKPVAYQFVNSNGDDAFDPGESIRFYGAAFVGPRLEKQFIINNVYWLWADGAPTLITQTANISGSGYLTAATFMETSVAATDRSYFATWTDNWDSFANEPDAWYWDYFPKGGKNPAARSYAFNLADPALSGPAATYTVEVFSRRSLNFPITHNLSVKINSYPILGSKYWNDLQYKRRSENIVASIPITALLNGGNNFDLTINTLSSDQIYLNQIAVNYLRQLKAVNDQLIFRDEVGDRRFLIGRFNDADWQNYVAWDVTRPLTPTAITLGAADLSGSGPYTLTLTPGRPAQSRFIVATQSAIQAASQNITVTSYTPASLNPPAGGADWLAISYGGFITEANVLAAHRANPQFGGYATYIADIEDIINQYGYGLPLPSAINNYLTYALGNWSIPPSYVTLIGDGTHNPRNLDCEAGCSVWSITATNYLLTDLVFKDRFQGAIPSDHTFTMLVGDDLLSDIAIGRIPVNTPEETAVVIAKIIKYETNQFAPEPWQENILFVSDNPDSGGDFCAESQKTGQSLPANYNQIQLCLYASGYPTITVPSVTDTAAIRAQMAGIINDPAGSPDQGISILNYRGHGSINWWAPSSDPNPLDNTDDRLMLMATSDTAFWANFNKPAVLLSADCLDGYFAWPGLPGLAETFLKLDNGSVVGTAAHWSSTGLGFTYEHTVLHAGLYDGVFDLGLTAIGDAINYSKSNYFLGGYDVSEMYAFTLEGDPAMQLFRPNLGVNKQSQQSQAQVGDQITYTLTISNGGIYAAKPVITDVLPAGLNYQSVTSTISMTTSVTGQSVRFDLQEPIGWGETAVITLTASVTPGAAGIMTNTAALFTPALNIDTTNMSDTAVIFINRFVYLPTIIKP